MIHFNKKYLVKYFSSFGVLLAFLVFVYQLHAQEVVSPPEPPVEETEALIEDTSTTTETEGEQTETPPEEEGQGILGDFIDFVEENVFNSENPEGENPPTVEEVSVEPTITEEVPEEPIAIIDGDLIPAPFFENKNALLVRGEVDVPKESIDYTNGSHTCSVTPFVVNISNTSAVTKVSIQNINHTGEESKTLVLGELPRGLNIMFANKEFSQNITSPSTEFNISIEKNANSQKGSFTVPILYSVGETTVICQVNIINR